MRFSGRHGWDAVALGHCRCYGALTLVTMLLVVNVFVLVPPDQVPPV